MLSRHRWLWLLLLGLFCAGSYQALEHFRRTPSGRIVVGAVRGLIEHNLTYPPPENQIACDPVAASPLPRFEGHAVASGERIYVFGGFLEGLKATVRSDSYNPAEDSWDRIADMPIAVTHAGFVSDDGRIWMAGGFLGDHPGEAVTDVWEYDVAADSWTPKTPLPAERASAGLALLGDRLHFIGGLTADRKTDAADHWVLPLDGSSGWIPKAPLPKGRNHFAAVAYEGKIYALGGQYGHDGQARDIDVAEVYDPETDEWKTIAPLPRPRSHFEPGTFIADGKIVIAGGRSNDLMVLYEITAYDPARDVWEDFANLPVALRAPLAKPIGPNVIIGQGGGLPTGLVPRDEMIRCTRETLGLRPL